MVSMMPEMNRAQIERAEKVARRLEGRSRLGDAVAEGKRWKRGQSLATQPVKRTRVNDYDFTEKQLRIAARSINAEGSV